MARKRVRVARVVDGPPSFGSFDAANQSGEAAPDAMVSGGTGISSTAIDPKPISMREAPDAPVAAPRPRRVRFVAKPRIAPQAPRIDAEEAARRAAAAGAEGYVMNAREVDGRWRLVFSSGRVFEVAVDGASPARKVL